MKRTPIVSILLATAVVIALTACNDVPKNTAAKQQRIVVPRAELRIAANPEEVSGKDDTTLHLQMTNVGNEAFNFFDSAPLRDFDITVRDPRGMPAPRTEEGERIKSNGAVWRNNLVTLRPGEQWETQTPLRKYFQMTEPGLYTVSVRRTFSDGHGQPLTRIVANPVNVSVAP